MNLGLTPPGYNMPPLRGWEGGRSRAEASFHEPGADAARLQHAAAARLGGGKEQSRGVAS